MAFCGGRHVERSAHSFDWLERFALAVCLTTSICFADQKTTDTRDLKSHETGPSLFANWQSSAMDSRSVISAVGSSLFCSQPQENCQPFLTTNARNSNSTRFTSADDFTPLVSGQLTSLCWWGAYQPIPGPFPDAFTVTYYADNAGVPGDIVGGPFVQASGTLTVKGPVDSGELILNVAPIFEYKASHAPVNVAGGNCYWIEIKNDLAGGANWFWEDGANGNGSNLDDGNGIGPPDGYEQTDFEPDDRAFCVSVETGDPTACLPPGACCHPDGTCTTVNVLDCEASGGEYRGPLSSCALENCPVIPPNDDCVDARVIDAVPFVDTVDTGGASADGPVGLCDSFGATGLMQNDVWYEWTADRDCNLRIRATPIATYDTIIAVRNNCIDLNELACVDNNGIGVGVDSVESLMFHVTEGESYLIQIGDNGNVFGGDPTLVEIECLPSMGACCEGQACIERTVEDCGQSGGVYLGDGVTCDVPPLGEPVVRSSIVNAPIPDGLPAPGGVGTPVSDTVTVTESFIVGDINLRVRVDHPFLSDVLVTLKHDGGAPITLMSNACGGNDNLDITFDDEGGTLECGSPTCGTFQPASTGGSSLYEFDGQDSAGAWTLEVFDDFDGDIGALLEWSIEIDAPGIPPCEVVCPNDQIPGDTGDADVDLEDFAALQECMGNTVLAECLCPFDADANGTVDVNDIALFAEMLSGPS
ncbi:MAG: hypothetical protein DHS20C16_03920 [Phycisphaerae bacterium]|nr:MAG: hypothetical protein DHS20C16_03920 [Phycisphaerae bacterium]